MGESRSAAVQSPGPLVWTTYEQPVFVLHYALFIRMEFYFKYCRRHTKTFYKWWNLCRL